MPTLKGLYDKIINMDVNKIIDKSIDNTVDALADINRERMLSGVDADGKVMPFYSKRSQEEFGKPNGPHILKDTGAFQSKLFSRRRGESIETSSTDEKADMLEKRYGHADLFIFGLSGDLKKKYQDEYLAPEINANINAETGLKFK